MAEKPQKDEIRALIGKLITSSSFRRRWTENPDAVLNEHNIAPEYRPMFKQVSRKRLEELGTEVDQLFRSAGWAE